MNALKSFEIMWSSPSQNSCLVQKISPACQQNRALLDFREQCVETLASGVLSFGQPDLEQTQKTKSVVYTQRGVTPRALGRLLRDRWEQIGEAMEYHWRRQIVAARGNLLSGLLGTGRQRTAEV